MRKYIWLAAVAALTLALSVGVATANAGGGNSANAKLCQKGGWMNLQGSDGTQFASEEECVSFGAHGGTIVAASPSVSISYTPTFDPNYCNVTVNLSHFTPNTGYSVNAVVHDGPFVIPYGPFPVTTDSSGSGSVFLFSYFGSTSFEPTSIDASVGSVESGFQTVAC